MLDRVLFAAALVVALQAVPAWAEDRFAEARRDMVATIEALAAQTGDETGRAGFSERVLQTMGRVPRHRFVPENRRSMAYANRPLPIGHGQTISQPYIVALMTDLVDVAPGMRVLEIGTGSGYQAAVLADLEAQVFSIEIVPPLGDRADATFKNLAIQNIEARIGDGYFGWEEAAPFDRILVTAAAGHVPPPLIRQLKPGGRMVIPVGEPYWVQYLTVVDKAGDGTLSVRQLLPVRFVPLKGGPKGQ